jgi:DNA-binding response OmpR family regulator
MMPGIDGVEFMRRLRARNDATPVLMLTAMDGVNDRVAGLDAGADDYLVKPFAMDELLARIRALSRRQAAWSPRDVLLAGDIAFDIERSELKCRERQVTLSRREAGLMEFLLRNRGQVLPRSVIIDRVWSDTIVEDGNLDIYIHFLRKQLREIKSQAKIETMRGVGYKLTV